MSNIMDIFNANNMQYSEIIAINRRKNKTPKQTNASGFGKSEKNVLLDQDHFPCFAEITGGNAVIVNTAW